MNIMTYLLPMYILLFASSCAETSSSSRSRSSADRTIPTTTNVTGEDGDNGDNGGGGSTGQTEDKETLIDDLLEREGELNFKREEVSKLESINDKLCSRLNKINKECLAKKPITANAKVLLVSCDGAPAEKTSTAKIEVNIDFPGSGDFKMFFHGTNSIYESVALTKGKQELKFTDSVDAGALTPTFSEIKKLRLVVDTLSPDSGKERETIAVSILVDGVILMKEFLPSVVAGDDREINVRKIYDQLISETCQLSNEALDRLISSSNSSIYDNDKPSATQSDYSRESTEKIKQRISFVLEELEKIEPDFITASDRNANLTQALRGGTNVGCRLKQKIETLSLKVIGSPVRVFINDKARAIIPSYGNARELEIDFGGMTFSTQDALGLLGGAEFKPDDDLTSLDIASITKISLRKGGVSYDDFEVKCNGGILSELGDNTCYHIEEEFAFDINKVELEVNGVVLFEEGDLQTRLYNGRLEWEYENIRSHPKWGEMLLRADCDATE